MLSLFSTQDFCVCWTSTLSCKRASSQDFLLKQQQPRRVKKVPGWSSPPFKNLGGFSPTAYFVMYLLAPMISQCKNSLTSSLLNLSHLFWSLSFSLDFPQMPANSVVAYSHVRTGRTGAWRSSGHWVRSVTLGFAGWRFG